MYLLHLNIYFKSRLPECFLNSHLQFEKKTILFLIYKWFHKLKNCYFSDGTLPMTLMTRRKKMLNSNIWTGTVFTSLPYYYAYLYFILTLWSLGRCGAFLVDELKTTTNRDSVTDRVFFIRYQNRTTLPLYSTTIFSE